MNRLLGICLIPFLLDPAYGAEPVNIALDSQPYLEAGLFSDPLLPLEGETVRITVRAEAAGEFSGDVEAALVLLDSQGKVIFKKTLNLVAKDKCLQAVSTWKPEKNGLYRVKVTVDPENRIEESSEEDNTAEMVLPVLAKGRKLFFPWYREMPGLRWATCITCAGKKEQKERLFERGVLPLNWQYGGMSWTYYDKEKAKTDPDAVLAEVEEVFYKKFTTPNDDVYGFGMDEIGGWPGSFRAKMSAASMKALVRARGKVPGRFYVAWHGGGVRQEVVEHCRNGVDLLLLETYIWRALPEDLGTEDIYQMIRGRLDTFIRGADMLLPAYGNPCYTLMALDTSERPDVTNLGEMEQVVRYIRRICPEMRGIAWYNGGYGSTKWGIKEYTPEIERKHAAIIAEADRLGFEYYVKPCLTFLRESLWAKKDASGEWVLTAALSNIGGVDSGPVAVEFLVDGKPVGRQTAASVPAGPNRNHNRAFLKHAVKAAPGSHRFEARIVSAGDSTVLDPTVKLERYVD